MMCMQLRFCGNCKLLTDKIFCWNAENSIPFYALFTKN